MPSFLSIRNILGPTPLMVSNLYSIMSPITIIAKKKPEIDFRLNVDL